MHCGFLNIQLNKWENIMFCPGLFNGLSSNKTPENVVVVFWRPTSAFVMYESNILIALAQHSWPNIEPIPFIPNVSTVKVVLHMH